MRTSWLACLILVTGPLFGQPSVLHLDPVATRIEYTLGDVLHTVHGTFKLKSGEIRFDAESGTAGGALVVDAASGDSGSGARDGRMNKNILETAKYPEITFTPDRFDGKLSLQGDSEVRLHGMFRIHGADHELVLPVQTHIGSPQVTADTKFRVPYVKWGMKNPSTLFLRVNDTVQIQIHAVGSIQ